MMNMIVYYSFNQWMSQWHSMTLSFNRFIHWLLHAWSVDPSLRAWLRSNMNVTCHPLGMFFCVVSGSHWDPDMPWPRKRAKLKELTWQPAQFTYFAVFLFRSHPSPVFMLVFTCSEKQGYFLHTQNDWNVRILIWPILAYPGMRI